MKFLWLFFGVTVILVHGEGLEFSLNRNAPGLPEDGSVCGILFCQVKAQISNQRQVSSLLMDNFSKITSLTIFQNMPTSGGGNDAGRLSELATVKTKKPRFQQVLDGIKGYGHLEPSYAMLRLQLRKDIDCQSEFTCQVEGLDDDDNERVGAARLLQQPKEKGTDQTNKEVTAWTPAFIEILSLLQSIKLKTETMGDFQKNLEERLDNLQTRFEDKLAAGFQRVEDKIWELESKACAVGGGSTATSIKSVSSFETNKTLSEILDATKRLEGTLSNKLGSVLPFESNKTADQTCAEVLPFLTEKLTTEINEFLNDREYPVKEVEKQLAGLANNFSMIIQSLDKSLNVSLSMIPEFPPEIFKALAGLLKSKVDSPLECKKNEGSHSSSVIEIDPSEGSVLDVPYLCDTVTDGGGWIIIQRRSKGDTDFFQGWDEYKRGFGTLETDFWLGNDNIHELTSQGTWELYVELKYDGETKYEIYQNFSIQNEDNKYELHVGSYSGTAGDSLSRHSGHPFTTKDKDNDSASTRNCATTFEGAWWYINCHDSNLNARWMSTTAHHGLMWRSLTDSDSATYSEMKIRKVAA